MADEMTAPAPPINTTDAALWEWAEKQMGAGFTVENIDASNVKVIQGGSYYEGNNDWFKTSNLKPEIFNNDEAISTDWNYKERVHFTSYATWKLTKYLDTKILPEFELRVEYPCAEMGKQPLSAKFQCLNNNAAEKTIEIGQDYDICEAFSVDPYTTTEVNVKLRTCCLEDVPFKLDVIFSGQIIVRGHKKRKFKTKAEVKGDIASALREVPGFRSVEGLPGQEVSMSYTLEGTCSGEAVVSVAPHFVELQTLV